MSANENAFPIPMAIGPGGDVYQAYDKGMSLRDWFAGQALAGILAGGFADTIPHDDIGGGRDAADYAYQYADAMLKARKE